MANDAETLAEMVRRKGLPAVVRALGSAATKLPAPRGKTLPEHLPQIFGRVSDRYGADYAAMLLASICEDHAARAEDRALAKRAQAWRLVAKAAVVAAEVERDPNAHS